MTAYEMEIIQQEKTKQNMWMLFSVIATELSGKIKDRRIKEGVE